MTTCNYTLLTVCLATSLLAALCAIVGCWLFLQRKNLFGDTIAHAALPGVIGVFLLTGIKNQYLFLIGGCISALLVTYAIAHIQQHSTLKKDTILGIMLGSSFGLSTLLLSKIQTMNNASQAGLTKYLYGNPCLILQSDILLLIAVTIFATLIIVRYIRSYSVIMFDSVYSSSINIPTNTIAYIMLILTTIIIILGLSIVGVILMSALLINPAATAFQWTKKLSTMMICAAATSSICCMVAIITSSHIAHMPTASLIVVMLTACTLLSLLIAPNGIIITQYRRYQHQKKFSALSTLPYFLLFNESSYDPYRAHNITALRAIGKEISKQQLYFLHKHGYLNSPAKDFWQLTPKALHYLQQQGRI